MSAITIVQLKEKINIVDVISNYTDLKGQGNKLQAVVNPIREGKTSSFFVYTNTQRWFDFGSGEGGDIIDFIKAIENLNTSNAISFLQEKYISSVHTHTKQKILPRFKSKPGNKDNVLLSKKVERMANKYLSAAPERMINGKKYAQEKWSMMSLEVEDADGNIIIDEVVRVHPIFEKLFEDYLIPTDMKYVKYLFKKVVGYCEYFNCPVIIIRDESEKVIDIVRYRPEREGKPLPMKYLYLKNELKPDSNYIFPLQAQMQKIMRSEGYCYVGEGLKNAITASLMGVPFISIESASNIKPGLIKFLKSNRMKGIMLIGAFDGDQAGEQAYKKINAEVPMENEFNFSSDIDFAEYLQEMRQ